MGTLADMVSFLSDTSKELETIKTKLNSIQKTFNRNYNNVEKIRNEEIKFLQNEYLQSTESFPQEFKLKYEKALKIQTDKFEDELESLIRKLKNLEKEYLSLDYDRKKMFVKLKHSNKRLDQQEEKLKEQVTELQKDIDSYNKQISELNNGFGFILNIFKMRKIQSRKEDLLEKMDILVNKIENTRDKWVEKSSDFQENENNLKKSWSNQYIDKALLSEKILDLKTNKKQIIKKAAFMSVLEELSGSEEFIKLKEQSTVPDICQRCGQKNEKNKFFCNYCGNRFKNDREDIMGSLIEVGELNQVYEALQNGMKESVSIIALMKGVDDGVKLFSESVAKVKSSQDRYSALSTLKIDIPKESKNFSNQIKEIKNKIDVEHYNYHPRSFTAHLKDDIDSIFSENNIELFFNAMGDELNKTTEEQW